MEVAIIIGSDSDWPLVAPAWELLKDFGIETEVRVLSAHRTPAACVEFVQEAEAAGAKVFIAAAGLAAHLPGAVAAQTRRPVIGLPVAAGPLQGQDALYSIVQMPPGVPVATVGIDNARNAALLAAEILALSDPDIDAALVQYRRRQTENVLMKDRQLQGRLEGDK
jgi:5-(carboxyamino)imidazole ribonucleotide mutase